MEIRLPQEKLLRMRSQIDVYKSRKKITLQELQSVIGLLNFACSVVPPGRTFLRRLIDLTKGLQKPHHRRRLGKEAKADLEAWSIFLNHFNGKSLFLEDVWYTSDKLQLFTDASGLGFGGYFGVKWFYDTRIPETCSNNESEPSICARRDVQALNSVSTYLIENALTVGTRASYRRAKEVYTTFQQKYFPDSQLFPISANQLVLFISHCFQKSLAPQTVLGYLSALTHFSKMEGHEDPTQHFKVKRAIQGFQKLKAKPDSRLPITPLMLQQIVNSLPNCTQSYYQMHLFKAMFLLAFHAFLRIGEITSSSLGDPLPLSAVSFGKQHDGSPESLCVTMVNFKHHIGKPPVTLQLSANKENKQLCPVLAIWDYMKLRGQNAGPLFMFQDKSPISRQYFNQQLKISLTFLNYDTKSYKGHSFRIGATTWAKSKGVSDDQIQLLGRWKSNAYRKYIRIPLLNL
ncbi:uncharacterized protein LOC134283613 isoform X1 [Saccostrea cucullata]|uniref:uncharacterized protein LOC134283613 isoform X1 n=1 Tax=Saccostrea cuccullata TaxID=36930 RepID=UPI002ED00424